jgi:DNA-binding NarL/FixJ family response regulator
MSVRNGSVGEVPVMRGVSGYETSVNLKSVVIVEDDPDIQSLIETIFSMDPRFGVVGLADSAEDALEVARSKQPQIIVLDDRLAGELTGVDAVPQLKAMVPDVKIILFTAHADLQARVVGENDIDAFLLKTETGELLPLAQQLTNMLSLL